MYPLGIGEKGKGCPTVRNPYPVVRYVLKEKRAGIPVSKRPTTAQNLKAVLVMTDLLAIDERLATCDGFCENGDYL